MRNQISFSDDDQSEVNKSICCWWRTCPEFDENGHLKLDLSSSASSSSSSSKMITPRVKVLREMERLAFLASEGLEDLRHKLVAYHAGDFWMPIGGVKKEEMNIPEVDTILLVGLNGSGKSSLVNLMYSVVGRSGLIPFAQTSGESSTYTTMFLEEHNVLRSVRSGLCVYDTRGFNVNQMEGCVEEELAAWMEDGVRHNQTCPRPGDDKSGGSAMAATPGGSMWSRKYVKRMVNFVVVVVDLAEVHKAFSEGDMKPMEAIRKIFHSPSIRKANENPILILTHGDMLSSEERVTSRVKICEFLGVSEATGAYDIPCLTEQGILPEDSDPVTAFALTEAIYRSLIQADRTHAPRRKLKDWALAFLSWIMCYIGAFFAYLANLFGHHKKLKM